MRISDWSSDVCSSDLVASWIVSPVFCAGFAALMLYFIKTKILYAEDRLAAANKWVPVLIALMAGAFMAYMSLKGLRQIWRPSMPVIAFFSGLAFALADALSRPYIAARVRLLANRRYDINSLFHLPLLAGDALLSFAHGATDL